MPVTLKVVLTFVFIVLCAMAIAGDWLMPTKKITSAVVMTCLVLMLFSLWSV